MVRYPGLAGFNYLQSGNYLLVCILRRNPGGGGVVKLPTLNLYVPLERSLRALSPGIVKYDKIFMLVPFLESY